MKIIKKIINWIKKLLNKWFGKKKVTKKFKTNIHNVKNKKYLKGYGVLVEESYNDSFPIYLMIDNEEKQELLHKINIIREKLNDLDEEHKDIEIKKIKTLIKKIVESDISVYQNNQINEKIELFLDENQREVKPKENRTKLYEDIFDIIDNFDDMVKEKVINEYKNYNYVTLTTFLIDETKKELKELETHLKKHQYNRNYYNRELRIIKNRILNLRRIRDGVNIQHEISLLRKDLYTKSKDKYDLLYNEEIFLNIEKECDDMLKKVNRKVIDLRKTEKKESDEKKEIKEKKEEKKEDKKQEEMLENIIRRFQDMELARKILLLNEEKEIQIGNIKDMLLFMNSMYMDFLNGEKVIFNYNRNKVKTELVKLYNNINKLSCKFNGENYISIDHINYPLDDLILATEKKKKDMEIFLEQKYNYKSEKHEESILVNNKLEIIKEEEMEKNNHRVLVKTNEINE